MRVMWNWRVRLPWLGRKIWEQTLESKVEAAPQGPRQGVDHGCLQWVATFNFLEEYMSGIKLYDISSTMRCIWKSDEKVILKTLENKTQKIDECLNNNVENNKQKVTVDIECAFGNWCRWITEREEGLMIVKCPAWQIFKIMVCHDFIFILFYLLPFMRDKEIKKPSWCDA